MLYYKKSLKGRVDIVDNKSIFISHSSLDFDFANKLCELLEENNLPCWIAPRDIPYGNIWPEKISSAIERAKVLIFIFTEHSNQSPQVLNEVNLALQNGIKIFPVHLTRKPYNPCLRYLLSLHQSIYIKNTDSDDEIKQIIFGVQQYLNRESDPMVIPDEFPIAPFDMQFNLDDELNAKFNTLFLEQHAVRGQKQPANDLRNKMMQRIGSRFVESMVCQEEDNESETTESDSDSSMGRYFSLAEQDAPTSVFIVRKQLLPPEYITDYTVEKLEHVVESLDGGSKKVTYFVESPDKRGNPLILISFLKGKEMVLVNMGFLSDDLLRISKAPLTLRCSYITPNDEKILRFPVHKQELNIILDPITGDAIPRKRYYDVSQKKWMHFVDVVANKTYMTFQIKADRESKATAFDIGYGYYTGTYGLTKNIIEAAVWFEKADTGEAYRYLSEIFSTDPLLQDEEDAAYYAKKAAEKNGSSHRFSK